VWGLAPTRFDHKMIENHNTLSIRPKFKSTPVTATTPNSAQNVSATMCQAATFTANTLPVFNFSFGPGPDSPLYNPQRTRT